MEGAEYVSTPQGILKIIEIIFGFITMILISVGINVATGDGGYILFASIYIWLISLILLLFNICEICHSRGFSIFEACPLALMVLFVFIAFIIAAVSAGRTSSSYAITITVLFVIVLVTSTVEFALHIIKLT